MEITPQTPSTSKPDWPADHDLVVDLTRPNRQAIHAATADLEARRAAHAAERRAEADRVDVSAAGRSLLQPSADDDARLKKLDALRQELSGGSFHTPERADKAARAMLGQA